MFRRLSSFAWRQRVASSLRPSSSFNFGKRVASQPAIPSQLFSSSSSSSSSSRFFSRARVLTASVGALGFSFFAFNQFKFARADSQKVASSNPVFDFFDRNTPFPRWYRSLMTLIRGDTGVLLPAETPDPFGQRPRTIVLGFENTLVFPTWERDVGWRFRKRPYLDAFVNTLAQRGYEIVLWSNGSINDWEMVMADFDQELRIPHRLFREHTNLRGLTVVKDLDRLCRDLKRVVMIDANPESTSLHPENAIHISGWSDDLKDAELKRLAQFLDKLQKYNAPDVRTYIKKFNENPDIKEIFAEDEKLEAEAKKNQRTTGSQSVFRGVARK